MYTYIHVYKIYICKYIHISIYIRHSRLLPGYVCNVYTYTYIYTYVYACVCINVYIYIYICIYIHAYIYTRMHVCIYTAH